MNYGKATSNIREQLAIYIIKNKLKSLVIGISGGMDSCLCAALAKPVCDELKIPLIGATLPSSTNENNETDRAKLTEKVFCSEFYEYQIQDHFEDLMFGINTPDLKTDSEEIKKSWKIRNGNIKTRLRMIYLYNLASRNNGMVLSTDNYTEYLLGFWTLHGDVGDYGMIQNLWKTEVYDMTEWLGDNEYLHKPAEAYKAIRQTIEALATDGLGVTSLGDLGQILPEWKGSSREGYKEVDRILQIWEDRFKIGSKQREIIELEYSKNPVIQRHQGTFFKRINPVNIPRAVILYGPSVK